MTAWTIPSYAEWAVPGYTEERLLGHGVSGRVVAAANEATGRRVAIKYFNASLLRDPEFLDEFRPEAQQLRSLDAPHAVRVFDYVEQPGEGAAVVMELVDGVSLREMIARKGPLGPQAALVVLMDTLIALAGAHARRVPHRDVKPDNLLIDPSGWTTLTDFGVAVRTDKHMPAAGTPAYMAPELWNGAPNVPASDLYAATAVCYETLTGKPPFSGRLGALRDQHESAPVPAGIDPQLRGLVEWGMAKYPADRPRSARAFAAEVEPLAAAAYGPYWEEQGRRQLAERAAELVPLLAAAGGGGGSATATRLARRKMLTFAGAGAVALVVLVAVGAVALSRHSDNAQLSSTTAAAFTAQATVTPPVAASKCTAATTFAYSGTVTAAIPGTLTYQWLYSSGKPGPVETLTFAAAGHRAVSGRTVKSVKASTGWAELKLLTPAAKTSNKATYKLLCGNGDVAVSASVLPAAQSVSSCAGTAPSLTASGGITSKKAGKVSYYWALGNGQNSAATTVTFSKPGTKAVTPLTFTPPALPANGAAVLVVTAPSAATSSPAAYSVSCTVPVTATPTGSSSAHPTTPASGTSPAKSSASPGASTAAPTTAPPTTTGPTTAPPTRTRPTTAPPTTTGPTTAPPTTTGPTTAPPTTTGPTTAPPTTTGPTTAPPTTTGPTTAPPTTTDPTTAAPATSAPTDTATATS
jgi:serine/threonine-protein kinase